MKNNKKKAKLIEITKIYDKIFTKHQKRIKIYLHHKFINTHHSVNFLLSAAVA